MENTNIFRAVWKKVLDRMTWRNYDWTVKASSGAFGVSGLFRQADLDSVFVPKRLISYVQAGQCSYFKSISLFHARTIGSGNMRRPGRGCG